MKKYGLIGFPLTHSFSERYFSEKFKNENISAKYSLYTLREISDLKKLLEEDPELVGLNVTIPYKKLIIQHLTEIDPIAEEVGAVNTLKIERKDKISIKGYNTDIYGFETLLKGVGHEGKEALVLGSGGAAAAVCFVLRQKQIPYHIVSRTPKTGMFGYDELTAEVIDNHKLIINTTPLGMFPNIETKPEICYGAIGKNHILIDLVYNPAETAFLREGRKRGSKTVNGATMLTAQAEKSFEIWSKDGRI